MRNDLKIVYLKLNLLDIKSIREFLNKVKNFIFGLILGHKFLYKLLIEK